MYIYIYIAKQKQRHLKSENVIKLISVSMTMKWAIFARFHRLDIFSSL